MDKYDRYEKGFMFLVYAALLLFFGGGLAVKAIWMALCLEAPALLASTFILMGCSWLIVWGLGLLDQALDLFKP